MSYQVLARKWRPRSFADLVGQGHVVQALSNGLERGQLHHAYLFTGTRGVGKTTLARILAKTLNCEQGVGATPCGVCSACQEIDQGRFVDLIEVDAASRTKVEQTRELLDNVPFAPVRGRFKVYLIDEVHMFSASSFNALLKTLEEPPEHVKFVLATTDPQKLPATVLSRCLQFNLKRLLPEQITGRFRQVLEAEQIEFEDPALPLLARAADGSMRDGLSLLDQAIAFGGGRLVADDVRRMLGTHTGDVAPELIRALGAGDGKRVLAEVDRLAELTPDFAAVLAELIALLHRVALAQQVPESVADDDPEAEPLRALAADLAVEDVQLFYQVLLTGQRDLPLAPDARTGFEMVLLRALAFRPADAVGAPSGQEGAGQPQARAVGRPAPGDSHEPSAAPPTQTSGGDAAQQSSSTAEGPSRAGGDEARPRAPLESGRTQHEQPRAIASGTSGERPGAGGVSEVPRYDGPLASAADWHRLVASLPLAGLARQLASHSALASWDGKTLSLILAGPLDNLRSSGAEQRLSAALSAALGRDLVLTFRADANGAAAGEGRGADGAVHEPDGSRPGAPISTNPGAPPARLPGDGIDGQDMRETPASRDARDAAERVAEAESIMEADPVAGELKRRFDADWIPGSIRPAE